MISDAEFRRYVREVEYHVSLIAMHNKRAGWESAAIPALTETAALHRATAEKQRTEIDWHCRQLTIPAGEMLEHGGVQRAFEIEHPQLELVAA